MIETLFHACEFFKDLKWHHVKTMCYLYIVRDIHGYSTNSEISKQTGIDPAVQMRILNNMFKNRGLVSTKGGNMFQLSKKGMRMMMDLEAKIKMAT